jgi:hypothetical protein
MASKPTDAQLVEIVACTESPSYFIANYCKIYDSNTIQWVPFQLWPAQKQTLQVIEDNKLVVVLKARQLGLSWLVLGYALHQLLFNPVQTVLLFSRREEESKDLLKNRLRPMYDRLPDWMKLGKKFALDNELEWKLQNNSRVKAFPAQGGDSYTATLAIVDEADLVPDLDRLLRGTKPTVDQGGKMLLISRADKSNPQSAFKKIYRAAKDQESPWKSVFLPWNARPDRNQEWYETQRKDILDRTGSEDTLHEQYPATDVEALKPRELDKRFPSMWLDKVYRPRKGLTIYDCLARGVESLTTYLNPLPGHCYVIGADPADNTPHSNESAAVVVDIATGEECALIGVRCEPALFAGYLATLAQLYNHAAICVERNNHGGAVLLKLRDTYRASLVYGMDGRSGFLTTPKTKPQLLDVAGDVFMTGDCTIHGFELLNQLISLEGSTLAAPAGELDDRAIAYCLALWARKRILLTTLSADPVFQITPGRIPPEHNHQPNVLPKRPVGLAPREDGSTDNQTGTLQPWAEPWSPPREQPLPGGW